MLSSKQIINRTLNTFGLILFSCVSALLAYFDFVILSLISIGCSYLAIIYLIDKHLEAHRKQFWQVPLIYAALTFYLAALFVTSMSFLHIPLIDVPNPTSFDYLYFSIITMTSVGYGDLTPISEKGKIVSLAMSIIGSGHMLVSVVLFIDKVKSQPVNPNAE